MPISSRGAPRSVNIVMRIAYPFDPAQFWPQLCPFVEGCLNDSPPRKCRKRKRGHHSYFLYDSPKLRISSVPGNARAVEAGIIYHLLNRGNGRLPSGGFGADWPSATRGPASRN